MTAGEWPEDAYEVDITDGTETVVCPGPCGKTTQIVLDELGVPILTGLGRDPVTGIMWCSIDHEAANSDYLVRVVPADVVAVDDTSYDSTAPVT